MVYEPAEDSFLLRRNVAEYAKGRVLDMGTGSGVLAEEAKKHADEVIGVDIDKDSVEYCRGNIQGIGFFESDLFSNVEGKFDLIIFNPPYLPDDKKFYDPALHGGKKGYEVIKRFFEDAVDYMKDDGKILLLFSSFSKKEKVDEIILGRCLDYKEIDSEGLFFEKLYVYLIEKSKLLKELEDRSVSGIRYFAKGKRGFLFEGVYGEKRVVVKSKNPSSEALGKIENEAVMLKRLNQYGIGPRLIFSGEDYIVYYFVEGVMFPEFIKAGSFEDIQIVLDKLFGQLQKLDELGVNKEEMHKPYKHILVNEKNVNVVLIDFERAGFTQKPHNITQFIKYLISKPVYEVLCSKGFGFEKDRLVNMAMDYRQGKVKAEDIRDYVKKQV